MDGVQAGGSIPITAAEDDGRAQRKNLIRGGSPLAEFATQARARDGSEKGAEIRPRWGDGGHRRDLALRSGKGSVVTVPVRSVAKGEAHTGVCQNCYGPLACQPGTLAADRRAVGTIIARSDRRARHAADECGSSHTGGSPARTITQAWPPRRRGCARRGSPRASRRSPRSGQRISIEETDKDVTVVCHRRRRRGAPHTFPRPARALRSIRARRSSRARSSTRLARPPRGSLRSGVGPRHEALPRARGAGGIQVQASTSRQGTSSCISPDDEARAAYQRATTELPSRALVDRFDYGRFNEEVWTGG